MNHSQEENWYTGKLGTKESIGYRRAIWTPVDIDDFNEDRQKYIDAGWQSYCWTKGSAGYDKYFLSKLPKDEFKHLLMVEKAYAYYTLFFHMDED